MCYKRIFYQGIREAGSNVLKITPNGIEISALNVDLDSSDLTLVKGALVKINSGGSVSGKSAIDTSDVEAAADPEKFKGYEGNETKEERAPKNTTQSVTSEESSFSDKAKGVGAGVVDFLVGDIVEEEYTEGIC